MNTHTTKRWVLIRSDGTIHTFSTDKECIENDTVNVDGKTYLKKQGRNFWNEYIRIGYVLDKKLSNKCKVWDMKEFNDMCRLKEN
jgi:pyoverdine/dityrosine biosynthesis protein Dit1